MISCKIWCIKRDWWRVRECMRKYMRWKKRKKGNRTYVFAYLKRNPKTRLENASLRLRIETRIFSWKIAASNTWLMKTRLEVAFSFNRVFCWKSTKHNARVLEYITLSRVFLSIAYCSTNFYRNLNFLKLYMVPQLLKMHSRSFFCQNFQCTQCKMIKTCILAPYKESKTTFTQIERLSSLIKFRLFLLKWSPSLLIPEPTNEKQQNDLNI